MTAIDARRRFEQRRAAAFTASWKTCRFCGRPSTLLWMPRLDHRRRKPWPEPFGTCEGCAEKGRETSDAESHPRGH